MMSREFRNSRANDGIGKDEAFVLFTIFLVLTMALLVSETVMSQTEGDITVDEQYYQILEQEYVKEIRAFLEQQGYRNSGVSLTRVVEDGERDYEVVIHHKNLKKLSEKELTQLINQVEALAFEVAGCTFQVGFLE